jgi:hypothetical protein
MQLLLGQPQMELATFRNVMSALMVPWQQRLLRSSERMPLSLPVPALDLMCSYATMCRTLQSITFNNLGLSGDLNRHLPVKPAVSCSLNFFYGRVALQDLCPPFGGLMVLLRT